jgi:D-alanine transaminase
MAAEIPAAVNGAWVPLAEAQVSAMDRGFLFGDGVYEVIPVYSRRPFRLAEHLARLGRSLAGIRLANPNTEADWHAIIGRIIDTAPWDDQGVYVQVTRGPMAERSHAFPAVVMPTVFVTTEPLAVPPPEKRLRGVSAVSAADFRWLRCDLKTTSLLANCLLRQLAVDAGCAETVIFRDGFLSEGSASNIFVVKNDTLLAPPKSHLMLPGVTYDVVLELAAAHGMPVEVRDVLAEEVFAADEVWLTSSPREVLPIVALDGRAIGSGKPGPVFARMYEWYQDFKREVMRGE